MGTNKLEMGGCPVRIALVLTILAAAETMEVRQISESHSAVETKAAQTPTCIGDYDSDVSTWITYTCPGSTCVDKDNKALDIVDLCIATTDGPKNCKRSTETTYSFTGQDMASPGSKALNKNSCFTVIEHAKDKHVEWTIGQCPNCFHHKVKVSYIKAGVCQAHLEYDSSYCNTTQHKSETKCQQKCATQKKVYACKKAHKSPSDTSWSADVDCDQVKPGGDIIGIPWDAYTALASGQ